MQDIENEQRKFALRPPKVESMADKMARALSEIRRQATDLDRWIYLNEIQFRDQDLFYNILLQNTKEFLPIVYTPTVGEVCTKYSQIMTQPRGLFFNRYHKGHIREIIQHYADTVAPEVQVGCVTDGSRILGLGDLGMNGHGITVGKLTLYCVTAGVDPKCILPMSIDAGCNTPAIREAPGYLGIQEPRIDGEEYNALVAELVDSFHVVYPNATLQFEDFSNNHAFDLLAEHRNKGFPVFNDDIQGTGCVSAACAACAFRAMAHIGQDGDPRNQRYVFLGAGAGGVGVADSLAMLSVQAGMSMDEARSHIFMVDSRGLIHTGREDYKNGSMQAHKLAYARAHGDLGFDSTSLVDIIHHIKPTVLVGLSTIGKAFNREVIEALCEHCEHPLVMALSNPTPKAECTSTECYEFSKGKAFYACGSPMPMIPSMNGTGHIVPSQSNNSYVFGAIGFGAYIGKCTTISDTMIAAVANAVAEQTPTEALYKGVILPDLADIREIAAHGIVAFIKQAQKEGKSRLTETDPEKILELVRSMQYQPAQY